MYMKLITYIKVNQEDNGMDSSEIKQLQILATKARMGAILGTFCAKSGHPGGSLSAADIFTYLYFKEMNVDPKNPKWEDRDRFVAQAFMRFLHLRAILNGTSLQSSVM